MNISRKVKYSILIASGIILLLMLIPASGFLKSLFYPVKPVFPETATVSPAGKVSPGENIRCDFTVTLPWGSSISNLSASGKSLISEPPEVTSSWRWDREKFQVQMIFKIMEPGNFDDGKIRMSVTDFSGKHTEKLEISIPALDVTIPEDAASSDALILAPETENPNKSGSSRTSSAVIWITAAAAVIITAAAIMLFIMMKKKKNTGLSLEARTIAAIEKILDDAGKRLIRNDQAFAMLCDILRNYLEKRFNMPATSCTTDEFIRQLNFSDTILPAQSRIFLTGFMNSADMIKFAGAEADDLMLGKAAGEAIELINVSNIDAEEKKR